MSNKKQLKLGDVVAKIAKILHIPHCNKCEERRLILNKFQTLGIKETLRKLKTLGITEYKKQPDQMWTTEEIIKKMKDCCNK